MRVQVFCYKFLNEWSDRRGYQKAVEFELPDDERDHMVVLEYIFEQLNVGGELVPATDWCREYREAGNPSLSVDDVVILGDKPWHCARFGWEPLEPDWHPDEDQYEFSFAKNEWQLKRPAPAA